MFLNSVHEQCPNSDPKQCTVTKLGWVHSAHTQNPGCVHTVRAVPMSWALLRAQQACRAHVASSASAGRAHAGHALVATRPGSLPPGRDLTSMSRHQGSQNHVATSNRCRDTTQTTPCRDIKSVSRHRFSCPVPKPGRDVLFPGRDLLKLRLCRDIVSMSRPPTLSPMSRH